MSIDVFLKLLAYAVAPLALAAIGNFIAARDIEDHRVRRHLQYSFFVLLVMGSLAGWLVEHRSEVEHEQEVQGLQDRLNELTQRSDHVSALLSSENSYLQGRLDTISGVLGGISASRSDETSAIIKAIAATARGNDNSGSRSSESAAQSQMGKLLAEGRELNSSCWTNAKNKLPATPELLASLRDWEKRAYASAASNADPKFLPLWDKFGSTPQDACAEFMGHLWGFRDIMTSQFSKPEQDK
jgi:hypothetical protein